MSPSPAGADSSGAIAVLISVVASVTSVLVALTFADGWHAVSSRPVAFASFLALTLALELVSVEVYGRGAFSFAGSGFLAIGFTFGVGPAMVTALLAAALNYARRGGKLHRVVFTAGTWALAAAAGTGLYDALGAAGWSPLARVPPAVAAGPLYLLVNIGLLSLAMGLSEGVGPFAVWRERFRWMTPYYLASGPLALALVIAFEKVGAAGLFAFALPPAFMMLSVRQYLARTTAAVEEIRETNTTLAERNEDLRELFEFAVGLAEHAHDEHALVDYAERALERVTGGAARLVAGTATAGIPLVAGGRQVAGLVIEAGDGFDAAQWGRLSDAIVPQLATAIERTQLVERVRRQHLATIAALSRSMEAKDYYTGGHTARVSEVAVALARRLGYAGAELDAVEIGALLHDIGKIGIPERILQKPGPLDEAEWKVMKEHPVISEYILADVDLPEIVLQIARSSHERIDGAGYPDGLAADAIPLPARIVLVADALDAMTTDRPYRHGRHLQAAMQELRANSGTQFCSRVIEVLEQLYLEEPQLLAAPLRAVDVA